MLDAPDQLRRDLDRAHRIIGGLTDTQSRRVLWDYIGELEARLAQVGRREAA